MSIKEEVIVKFLNVKIRSKYVYYKKVIMKVFKRKDSIKIGLLKKRVLWNSLIVKVPTKYVNSKNRLLWKFLNVKIPTKYLY